MSDDILTEQQKLFIEVKTYCFFKNYDLFSDNDIKQFVKEYTQYQKRNLQEQFISKSDIVHGIWDVAGIIPGWGEIIDGLHGVWYFFTGQWIASLISFASMIPLIGDAAKIAKYSKYGWTGVKKVLANPDRIKQLEAVLQYMPKVKEIINDFFNSLYGKWYNLGWVRKLLTKIENVPVKEITPLPTPWKEGAALDDAWFSRRIKAAARESEGMSADIPLPRIPPAPRTKEVLKPTVLNFFNYVGAWLGRIINWIAGRGAYKFTKDTSNFSKAMNIGARVGGRIGGGIVQRQFGPGWSDAEEEIDAGIRGDIIDAYNMYKGASADAQKEINSTPQPTTNRRFVDDLQSISPDAAEIVGGKPTQKWRSASGK